MFYSWLLVVMSLSQGILLLRPMNIHVDFGQMVLRELKMEQLIRILQKTNICFDAIFQRGLITSRSKSTFRGYQNTFSNFLDSMIAGSKMAGHVDIDVNETAVNQL